MNYTIIMILIYSIHLELKATRAEASVNIHQELKREFKVQEEMVRRPQRPRDKIDEIIYEFSEPKNPSKLFFQPHEKPEVLESNIEHHVKVGWG